jgi:hypothetical protein
MFKVDSVVAIYDTHEQAEQAVKDLQEAGVDMKSLSIAAKNMHVQDRVVGYYTLGDRMKHWGKLGAFWAASGGSFSTLPYLQYRASGRFFWLGR